MKKANAPKMERNQSEEMIANNETSTPSFSEKNDNNVQIEQKRLYKEEKKDIFVSSKEYMENHTNSQLYLKENGDKESIEKKDKHIVKLKEEIQLLLKEISIKDNLVEQSVNEKNKIDLLYQQLVSQDNLTKKFAESLIEELKTKDLLIQSLQEKIKTRGFDSLPKQQVESQYKAEYKKVFCSIIFLFIFLLFIFIYYFYLFFYYLFLFIFIFIIFYFFYFFLLFFIFFFLFFFFFFFFLFFFFCFDFFFFDFLPFMINFGS